MTSPFTGGEVRLCEEPRSMTYRKEQYNYIHRHYQCVDTGMYFTDTELDTENLEQVHAQYREKYGIPAPAEIAQTRQKYGLSASKISLVLGLGVNQYRLYEAGEMPSEAIGKMLKSIQTPMVFYGYVENARKQMSQEDYTKMFQKVQRCFIETMKKMTSLSEVPDMFYSAPIALQ